MFLTRIYLLLQILVCSSLFSGDAVKVDESLFQNLDDLGLDDEDDEDDPDFNPDDSA